MTYVIVICRNVSLSSSPKMQKRFSYLHMQVPFSFYVNVFIPKKKKKKRIFIASNFELGAYRPGVTNEEKTVRDV